MLILIGSAGKNFDTRAISIGTPGTVTGNRVSFFALIVATIIGFATLGADWFVYYPPTTSKRAVLCLSWLGLMVPLLFCEIVGVGIGTGTLKTPSWNAANEVSPGALLLACYDGLGSFGRFCVVLLALSTITNEAPAAYSAGMGFQILGSRLKAIPRWWWCVVITLIELVCSVAGRNNLYSVFSNFLPIMSYWVWPWITIGLEEHLIFHTLRGVPFDWTTWENKKKLPVGVAALAAWMIGWAGAIIGMSQTWYQGPVAALIGDQGGDIGAWLAVAFAAITFPPLRFVELRKLGR